MQFEAISELYGLEIFLCIYILHVLNTENILILTWKFLKFTDTCPWHSSDCLVSFIFLYDIKRPLLT